MKTYPLVSDYKKAITEPESFAILNNLTACYIDNNLYFATGGPAVVFKMQDDSNNYHALKCFIKEQPLRKEHFNAISDYLKTVDNNSYFVDYEYYDSEIWVNDDEYPVLIMPWIEGKTLSIYISELCRDNNKTKLKEIANKFDKMALWLLNQDLAHGDLKPDNIMVTIDDELKLVDYDGMFVPALSKSKSLELGTAEYRHPKRTSNDFNKNLDDFPILVLSLSLHALASEPSLYVEFTGGDALLFKSSDYSNLLLFPKLSFFQNNADDNVLHPRFSTLMYSVVQPVIELVGLKELLEETAKDVKEIGESFTDEQGAEYCDYGKTLVRVPSHITQFIIPDSVTSIGDDAFESYFDSELSEVIISVIESITIPDSVTSIGNSAFSGCRLLETIIIPDSVTSIGNYAFYSCESLESITIPDSVTSIGNGAFSGCRNLESFEVNSPHFVFEDGILYNKDKTFLIAGINNIINKNIIIPDTVTTIGDGAFDFSSFFEFLPYYEEFIVSKIKSINIPNSVISIGNYAFSGCKSLKLINIPNSVISIGNGAFYNCNSFHSITIPNSITSIGDNVFSRCYNLKSIDISKSVTSIGDRAFYACESLESIIIPNSVISFGNEAFSSCHSLKSLNIPDSVTTIGDEAFSWCRNLTSINIPNSVTSIGDGAFSGCFDLDNTIEKELIKRFGQTIFEYEPF